MRPELAGWTAVLAGSWNQAIFTPAWIAREVFSEAAEIPVELALAFGVDERILKFPTKQIEFRVAAPRIIIRPTVLDESALRTVNASVETILRILQHTPIAAVGFNFAFSTEAASERLKVVLAAPDSPDLEQGGMRIQETKSVKRLGGIPVAGDPVLNLTLQREHSTSRYSMELNYHYDRTSLVENGRDVVIPLRNHAIRVLACYGESMEEESA